MKNLLFILFTCLLISSNAYAQTAFWDSTDASATTTEMRIPLDIGASDIPSYISMTLDVATGVCYNNSGNIDVDTDFTYVAASGNPTATGTFFAGSGYDCTGAVDCDFGSADITDVDIITDGGTVKIDGDVDASNFCDAAGSNCVATANVLVDADIGVTVQAFDVVLDDLAALSAVADNEIIVGTGAGTYAHESGATARTSLGLAIGTDVQAFDAVLDDLSALSVIADNEFIVGTGAGTYANESGATARTSMGVAIGTDVQAFDAVLDDLSALSVIADNEIIVGTGAGTYANESGATARTSLGLAIGVDVQAFDANNALTDVAQEYTAQQNFNATTLTPLGADLVTNGTFASDTNWTKGTGWTIGSGVANSDATQSADSDLTEDTLVLVSGNTYEVTFTVTNYVAGNVTPVAGGTEGTDRAANGTFIENILSAGTDLDIRGDLDFDGDIDDVIVKLANVSWNLNSNQVTSLTLDGDLVLDNPTNQVDGSTYIINLIQDGTGSQLLTYGTVFKFPGGTAPTLTTAASSTDILTCVSNGTNMNCVFQADFK